MKKIIITILTLNLIVTFGCQTDFELNRYLNRDSPLVRRTDSKSDNGLTESKIDTIQLDSGNWKKLVEFASNNQTGWKSTPASYNADYSLKQKNFMLLGWKKHNSIVIRFKDEYGKPKQLTKEVKKGELDFLLN